LKNQQRVREVRWIANHRRVRSDLLRVLHRASHVTLERQSPTAPRIRSVQLKWTKKIPLNGAHVNEKNARDNDKSTKTNRGLFLLGNISLSGVIYREREEREAQEREEEKKREEERERRRKDRETRDASTKDSTTSGYRSSTARYGTDTAAESRYVNWSGTVFDTLTRVIRSTFQKTATTFSMSCWEYLNDTCQHVMHPLTLFFFVVTMTCAKNENKNARNDVANWKKKTRNLKRNANSAKKNVSGANVNETQVVHHRRTRAATRPHRARLTLPRRVRRTRRPTARHPRTRAARERRTRDDINGCT